MEIKLTKEELRELQVILILRKEECEKYSELPFFAIELAIVKNLLAKVEG